MYSRLITIALFVSQLSFGQDRLAFVRTDDVKSTLLTETPTNAEAILVTPFELDGGMIIVEAVLDGIEQSFILDTGSPSLVLNNYTTSGKPTLVSGVAGSSKALEIKLDEFLWAGVVLEDVNALSLDMSQFEKAIDRKIGGLIGYELIKNHELYIDYKSRIIRMYPRSNSDLYENKKPLTSFPFEMQDHIPVIKAQIGNRILRLGLDTGAEVNVLNTPFEKELSSDIQQTSSSSLVDLNNKFTQLTKAKIASTKIGAVKYREMEYLFVNLSDVNQDEENQLDGILGYPFFSTCTLSINFETQRVYIWEVE